MQISFRRKEYIPFAPLKEIEPLNFLLAHDNLVKSYGVKEGKEKGFFASLLAAKGTGRHGVAYESHVNSSIF